MGNVVLWKPSPSNVYASNLVYKILLEATIAQLAVPAAFQFVATPLMKKELSRGSWDLRFFKVFSSCALSGEPLM